MINPLKNRALHLPGQSLDEELQTLWEEEILFFYLVICFILFFVFYEWVKYYFAIPPQPVSVTIAGGLSILFCLHRIRKSMLKAKILKQGRDGERIVGQQLEELRADGCFVFHDVIGDNFNVDHVVVSPHGIFSIETKTWSKRGRMEEIDFDGKNLIVNGRVPDKDPIVQSIGESQWLNEILHKSTGTEFQVKPVVLFPGWFVSPECSKLSQQTGVWLLNPKALPSYIKNMPVILNKEELNMISFHLARYINTTL